MWGLLHGVAHNELQGNLVGLLSAACVDIKVDCSWLGADKQPTLYSTSSRMSA